MCFRNSQSQMVACLINTILDVIKTSVCCIITASTAAKSMKATANKLYPYELCFINLSVLFKK